jgi:hypothetical protein
MMTTSEILDLEPELRPSPKLAHYQRQLARHPHPQDPDYPERESGETDLFGLIEYVRKQCDLAEKHLAAQRRVNVRLALEDACGQINETLGLE